MLKQKKTLVILWLTFITVVAWIGLNIFHIMVTSTISDIDAASIEPINATFDTDIINELKTRETVEPLYQFIDSSQENISSQEAQAILSPTDGAVPEIFEEP